MNNHHIINLKAKNRVDHNQHNKDDSKLYKIRVIAILIQRYYVI